METDLLHLVIRHRIEEGRLPRGHLIELGHGHGIGQICDGCGDAVAWNQRMTVRICRDDWRTVRLHEGCFQIWEAERIQGDGNS